jgi:hypothetical protein
MGNRPKARDTTAGTAQETVQSTEGKTIPLFPEKFPEKERTTVNLAKPLFEFVRSFGGGRLAMKEVFEYAVRLWLTIYADMLKTNEGQGPPALVPSDVGHSLQILAARRRTSEPLLVREAAELLVALHGAIGVHHAAVYGDIENAARLAGHDLPKEIATRVRLATLLTDVCPAAATARSADDLTRKLLSLKLEEST